MKGLAGKQPNASIDVYSFFPNIENFRNRASYPDIQEAVFWTVFERCKSHTLLTIDRFYDIYKAVEYIAKNGIQGDYVECGVFLGGSILGAALFAKHFEITRQRFFLYDTFDGFPENSRDTDFLGEDVVFTKHENFLHVVQGLIADADVADYEFVVVKGPVETTLKKTPHRTPISILRLDTDYYESTYLELKELYPLLVPGGVLIIDDYGHFKGARRAVNQYFAETKCPMLLHRTDYSGRSGIKPRDCSRPVM